MIHIDYIQHHYIYFCLGTCQRKALYRAAFSFACQLEQMQNNAQDATKDALASSAALSECTHYVVVHLPMRVVASP